MELCNILLQKHLQQSREQLYTIKILCNGVFLWLGDKFKNRHERLSRSFAMSKGVKGEN
jgi:hypothetical protein